MIKLTGFGKVHAVGHRYTQGLLDEPVEVTEKLDGSQFSFGVVNGELHMRSKRAVIYTVNAPKMFVPAVCTAKVLFEQGQLREGYIYRGEAFQSANHNALRYNRPPQNSIALYGVDRAGGGHDYLQHAELTEIAEELGLEAVPLLYSGMVNDLKTLDDLLEKESMLGGAKIEGVVLCRRDTPFFGPDGKPIRAKYVSEAFKETNEKAWRKKNPKKADILETIRARYAVPARWQKAVQTLAEEGKLQGAPQDIGLLIKAVKEDIKEECEEDIKDMLFASFIGDILRGSTRGLPEWYKRQLAEQEFASQKGAQ